MNLWDRIFPPLPDMAGLPPLQPQIEAWTDNSHLAQVVFSDLGIDTSALPLTRAAAMRVPAVVRARNLTAGTTAALPLRAMRAGTLADPQPYWMYGTDGQLGDLTPAQCRAWHVGPQAPWHRMVWTIDDHLFHGESLWIVTRFAADKFPSRMVRIPWDHWEVQDDGTITDPDMEPFPADRIVYLPGPNEGMLDFGRDTIRTAFDLERNAAEVARRPLRLEVHQTSAAELTEDERRAIKSEVRAAMGSPDGILFTNNALETIEHRVDSDALQLGARNASALDVARDANMPATMLDASTAGASLEYATLQGRNQQWLDYGLSMYLDAVEARLSMDDILPAGQRSAFDTSEWTGPNPTPTGSPEQD